MHKLLLITASWLLFTGTYAQTTQDKQLEKKLDELLSASFATGPGCEVLVARQGNVVYKKAFGSANLELNVPVQPDMIFRLGSITKQFTAVAILQLVEQGKLQLQDSLQQYIKTFPSKTHPITIEHLLTHTSGIPDYTRLPNVDEYAERRDYGPPQIINLFKNLPLEFDPGTQFKYNNSGYFLLGAIIEKVSGKSYQAYVQQNILTPLGLQHTYFDRGGVVIPNRVSGYKMEGAVYRNADYWSMTVAYAAGELLSNVEDLFAWHKGLYMYKILKKETLEKAFTPFKLKNGMVIDYGYGWIVKQAGGIHSIEHGGSITGFLTQETYFPAEDIFIAALFNCECTLKDQLSINIASLALGKALQNDVNIPAAMLDEYVGTYTLATNNKRTITIFKENNRLWGKLSAKETFPLLFQSPTKFQFKDVLGAECEFIRENGKVVKFKVDQSGVFEWIKNQ